jgi:hypothetical protein
MPISENNIETGYQYVTASLIYIKQITIDNTTFAFL